MDAAEIERVLNIPISSKAFASMETGIPDDVLANPYRFFENVRAREGDVIRVENATVDGVKFPLLGSRDRNRPVYVALGFNTVRETVANRSIYQNYGDGMDVLMGPNQLAGLNPPLHSKYRALVNKAFELHSLPTLTATVIEPLVDGMIDRILAGGEHTELMESLACRLPVFLIGHIFALPTEQYDEFAGAAGALMAGAYNWHGAVAASAKLKEMFDVIIAEKRQAPGTDLISKLILSEVDGEQLSHDDIISTCRALIPAGIETTVRALGTLCTAILRYPDQVAQVQRDPDLVPVFLDELLRWNGPAQMLPKRTLQDTEIAGTIVPANAHLHCYIGHANRDPSYWERPDEFDIGRKKQPHLAFSFGAHFCVGNQFARREMETVLKKIIQRLPELRLDPDAPQPEVKGVVFRSPDHVHALTGAA